MWETSRIQRPKCFAAANILQRKEIHGHHSVDHLNSSVDRRATCVAVQFRLGLLAQRRTWIDSSNSNNPRLDGTPVNGGATLSRALEGRRSLR